MEQKINMKSKKSMTFIVIMHYTKLILRTILFLTATTVYIFSRIFNADQLFENFIGNTFLLALIWVFFAIGMILRFFPSKAESMGCQKQFEKNYKPLIQDAEKEKHYVQPWIVTFSVFSAWIALNAVIGILYYTHIIDAGILLLISLAYSVCDIICILFFCPFQTWFMKNKCCTTCRIYNWDYAMMFTPLIYIPTLYTWSLLVLALILLAKWEYLYHKHSERFSDKCNASLSCKNCKEKLCHHKKQLRSFLRKRNFNLNGNTLFKKK